MKSSVAHDIRFFTFRRDSILDANEMPLGVVCVKAAILWCCPAVYGTEILADMSTFSEGNRTT